jgi:TP901 family phage tail tape measure protein
MSIRVNVVGTYDGRDINRAQKDLGTLKIQADSAASSMVVMGGRMKNVGDSMASAGARMTRGLTLPIVGVGVAGAKLASDLETSFAQIEGLVGVSGGELDELREAALRLGPTFGKSAGEAAEALFFITSAGLRGTDATEALERSLMASAVGLGEVSTIADLTTSIMNAYGSDVVSAAQATDVLTGAVREGKLEPAELAGAMGAVLPLASAMGISIDEVGATFAAMSRTGTGASEAATQLRGIMTGLLKPTVAAEEALSEMGLSSEGLREQVKEQGLLSVLETLTEAFEDNEVGAEQVFGNVRALSGVLDLMGSNVEGTREIFDNMADTTGLLGDAFDITADTAGFQFAKAMAEAKTALTELGEIVLPVFRDITERVSELIKQFQALSPEQKEQIVRFAGIVAVVGPALFIFGKLVAIIGTVIKVGGLLVAAVSAITLPMLAVVAAIAGVIAIGVLLFRNWDTVKEKASDTWSSVADAFSRAWETMKGVARTVANFIIGYYNAILSGIEKAINAIGRQINRLPKFTAPSWVPVVGGKSFSLPNVPNVSFPRIPALAEGGIVRDATLALIGEAGPEAVIPLDRLDGTGGPTIVLNVSGAIDPEGTARTILRTLRDAERRTGERLFA